MVITFKRADSPTSETIEVEELTIRASSNPSGQYDLEVTLETLKTRADTEGVVLQCTAARGEIFIPSRAQLRQGRSGLMKVGGPRRHSLNAMLGTAAAASAVRLSSYGGS